jgi:hypothetical protein
LQNQLLEHLIPSGLLAWKFRRLLFPKSLRAWQHGSANKKLPPRIWRRSSNRGLPQFDAPPIGTPFALSHVMLTRLLQGAIAGLIATVPMTAAMESGADQLPRHERYPLPPRLITRELARKSGISHDLNEPEMLALTIAAHFGYGAAMGTAYRACYALE